MRARALMRRVNILVALAVSMSIGVSFNLRLPVLPACVRTTARGSAGVISARDPGLFASPSGNCGRFSRRLGRRTCSLATRTAASWGARMRSPIHPMLRGWCSTTVGTRLEWP